MPRRGPEMPARTNAKRSGYADSQRVHHGRRHPSPMPGSGAGRTPMTEVDEMDRRINSWRAAVFDDGAHRRAPPPARPQGAPPASKVACSASPAGTRAAGVGQARAPVHPTTLALPGHGAKQLCSTHAEVRHRPPRRRQRSRRAWCGSTYSRCRTSGQRASPRVEQLDGVRRTRAKWGRRSMESDGDVGQAVNQRTRSRFAEHHRLGAFVVAARPPSTRVGTPG